MRRPSRTRRRWFVTIAAVSTLALTACGDGREVTLPGIDRIAAPTFATVPADLSRSPALAALVGRYTADLPPTGPSADGSLLAGALDALAALPEHPTRLSRLTISADQVYFTFEVNGIVGRQASYVYRPGETPRASDPAFDDKATYPVSIIQPTVPTALIAAIEKAVPNAHVTTLDLAPDLSYGFGLTWYLRVEDARGTLADVFADPDGAIVAVDMS